MMFLFSWPQGINCRLILSRLVFPRSTLDANVSFLDRHRSQQSINPFTSLQLEAFALSCGSKNSVFANIVSYIISVSITLQFQSLVYWFAFIALRHPTQFYSLWQLTLSDNIQSGASMVIYGETGACAYTINKCGYKYFVLIPWLAHAWVLAR